MNNTDGIQAHEITASNIADIEKTQSVAAEQRICEISDLAHACAEIALEMFSEGYGIYEILSVISEGIFSSENEPHSGVLTENLNRIKNYLKLVSEYDKIIFTELFRSVIAESGITVSESDFLYSDEGNGIISYVKNQLADEAYDVFSQDISDPRLRYAKTLSEAALAVSDNESEYALLPLEEKGGARLASVAEILFREDLKINSVTPVFGFEGTADMKYALVSKHFTIPEVCDGDDRYLEIRLRVDSSISLSELLLASDFFEASLYRVNTISFDSEDGRADYYSIVFKDDGGDFSLLLIYLTLFSGAYTPIGLYKNLE